MSNMTISQTPCLSPIQQKAQVKTSQQTVSEAGKNASKGDHAALSGLAKGALVGAATGGVIMGTLPFVGEMIYKQAFTDGWKFKSAVDKSLFLDDVVSGGASGAVMGALGGAVLGYQVGKHAESKAEGAKAGAIAGAAVGGLAAAGVALMGGQYAELIPAAVLLAGIATGSGALTGYMAASNKHE